MTEAAQATALPIMSARRVSMFGALLIAVGPVSMAMYTPALPEIVHAFNTTEALAKLTMTLYFGGFACAQLIAGPISDAVGRRPVTFWFIGLFVLATIAAMIAPNIESLIVARFVQGFGASAGVALSRAVVRDVFEGDESSRIMNLIGIIMGLGPAFSPTIGGVIVTFGNWQAVFAVMGLFGLAVILLTQLFLKETVAADPGRLNFKSLIQSYVRLGTNMHFIVTCMAQAGAIGAIFAQSTILPFVLMNRVGLSAAEFGIGMLMQSGGFFVGSLVVRYLMGRLSAYRLVPYGMISIGVGSVLILNLFFFDPSYLQVMGPICLFAFGIAFVMPAMTTAALAPFPSMAGAASSLLGFTQLGMGLAVGTLAALWPDPVAALAVLTPFLGLVAIISYFIYVRSPHLAEPEGRT